MGDNNTPDCRNCLIFLNKVENEGQVATSEDVKSNVIFSTHMSSIYNGELVMFKGNILRPRKVLR